MQETLIKILACLIVMSLASGQTFKERPTVTFSSTSRLTTPFTTTRHTTATLHLSTTHNGETLEFNTSGVPVNPLLPVLSSRKVAFSVRKAEDSLRAFTLVHFRDVLANVGGGWIPATSEFVAPYDGKYFFIFHAIGGRASDFTMALTKNGKFEVTAYGTLTAYKHGSNSAVLELKRQDRVALELQQGAIYEHPGNETYTTFTGFLIF